MVVLRPELHVATIRTGMTSVVVEKHGTCPTFIHLIRVDEQGEPRSFIRVRSDHVPALIEALLAAASD